MIIDMSPHTTFQLFRAPFATELMHEYIFLITIVEKLNCHIENFHVFQVNGGTFPQCNSDMTGKI